MSGARRLAVPMALLCGGIVFLAAHLLLQGANWPLAYELVADSVLFLLASYTVWSLLDSRTSQQVEADSYSEEAEERVKQVLASLKKAQAASTQIANPNVKQLVAQISADTEVLLNGIREANPSTLQSSAIILGGHLESLNVVIHQYSEIERRARFFDDPAAKLQAGENALQGFEEFLVKSIKLLEQGDTLNYAVALKGLEATKYSLLA